MNQLAQHDAENFRSYSTNNLSTREFLPQKCDNNTRSYVSYTLNFRDKEEDDRKLKLFHKYKSLEDLRKMELSDYVKDKMGSKHNLVGGSRQGDNVHACNHYDQTLRDDTFLIQTTARAGLYADQKTMAERYRPFQLESSSEETSIIPNGDRDRLLLVSPLVSTIVEESEHSSLCKSSLGQSECGTIISRGNSWEEISCLDPRTHDGTTVDVGSFNLMDSLPPHTDDKWKMAKVSNVSEGDPKTIGAKVHRKDVKVLIPEDLTSNKGNKMGLIDRCNETQNLIKSLKNDLSHEKLGRVKGEIIVHHYTPLESVKSNKPDTENKPIVHPEGSFKSKTKPHSVKMKIDKTVLGSTGVAPSSKTKVEECKTKTGQKDAEKGKSYVKPLRKPWDDDVGGKRRVDMRDVKKIDDLVPRRRHLSLTSRTAPLTTTQVDRIINGHHGLENKKIGDRDIVVANNKIMVKKDQNVIPKSPSLGSGLAKGKRTKVINQPLPTKQKKDANRFGGVQDNLTTTSRISYTVKSPKKSTKDGLNDSLDNKIGATAGTKDNRQEIKVGSKKKEIVNEKIPEKMPFQNYPQNGPFVSSQDRRTNSISKKNDTDNMTEYDSSYQKVKYNEGAMDTYNAIKSKSLIDHLVTCDGPENGSTYSESVSNSQLDVKDRNGYNDFSYKSIKEKVSRDHIMELIRRMSNSVIKKPANYLMSLCKSNLSLDQSPDNGHGTTPKNIYPHRNVDSFSDVFSDCEETNVTKDDVSYLSEYKVSYGASKFSIDGESDKKMVDFIKEKLKVDHIKAQLQDALSLDEPDRISLQTNHNCIIEDLASTIDHLDPPNFPELETNFCSINIPCFRQRRSLKYAKMPAQAQEPVRNLVGASYKRIKEKQTKDHLMALKRSLAGNAKNCWDNETEYKKSFGSRPINSVDFPNLSHALYLQNREKALLDHIKALREQVVEQEPSFRGQLVSNSLKSKSENNISEYKSSFMINNDFSLVHFTTPKSVTLYP